MNSINLPYNKHIGVMFSGGADSSMLLFLLHHNNITEEKNCRIVPYTVSRRTGTAMHVASVVNYLKNYFKTDIPAPVFVGDPNVVHNLFVPYAISDALNIHKVDMLFVGCTKNPNEVLDTKFIAPDRPKSRNPKIQQPFLEFDKRHVVELCFEYNQQELMALTHSCSIKISGRCNYCFFCKERAWAFSKLGLIDPGTN
jgi:hypothetical protein